MLERAARAKTPADWVQARKVETEHAAVTAGASGSRMARAHEQREKRARIDVSLPKPVLYILQTRARHAAHTKALVDSLAFPADAVGVLTYAQMETVRVSLIDVTGDAEAAFISEVFSGSQFFQPAEYIHFVLFTEVRFGRGIISAT